MTARFSFVPRSLAAAASSLAPAGGGPFAGARGFVLRDGATGPFTEVRFPGAPRTLVTGINNRGSITGVYENPDAAATAHPVAPQGRAAHSASSGSVRELA